jgi:hypothetical protein
MENEVIAPPAGIACPAITDTVSCPKIRLKGEGVPMKTLTCDTCGHDIDKPVADRNYFHVEDWDVCEPCKEAIEAEMRPVLRGEKEFHQENYRDLYIRLITERANKIRKSSRR